MERNKQPLAGPGRKTFTVVVLAALFFLFLSRHKGKEQPLLGPKFLARRQRRKTAFLGQDY